ncbi:MAG: hypothetical protein ABIK44_05840 [candidate division WOR-3 bacterium]
MSEMNQEPKPPEDSNKPERNGIKEAEPRPTLVFKPDPSRERRIAQFRKWVLIVTAVIVGTALVLILRIQPDALRPRPAPLHSQSLPPSAPEKTTPSPVVSAGSVTEDQRAVLVAAAVQAVASIDSAVAWAMSRWQRAQACLPTVMPVAEQLEPAIARVRQAQVIAESAALDLTAAQQAAERIRETSRRPGLDGYRLSILYTAAQNYLSLLNTDLQDRRAYLEASSQAFQALANSDQNEFEIKQNVANGYARKIDIRQRRIQQAKQQLQEQLAAVRLAR